MKANEELIPCVGLMPHAPVLIPEVGGGREREADTVVAALRELSRRMTHWDAEHLILISPHSPRRSGRFGCWSGKSRENLEGSLAQFGCPQVRVALPNDRDLNSALMNESQRCGVALWEIQARELDHGAVVPLYFLIEAGWDGPISVLSLNYPGEGGLEQLGAAIAAAASRVKGRVLVLASGDMSHRLKPGAPSGFHPRARDFDAAFVDLAGQGRYDQLKTMDPDLVDLAAEDVVDSTRVAVASVDARNTGHEVLAYAGPFGVGYCVAVLYEAHE